jgi:hypothetical protein
MSNTHPVAIRRTALAAIRGLVRSTGGHGCEEIGLTIEKKDYRLVSISTLPRPTDAEAVPLVFVEEVQR